MTGLTLVRKEAWFDMDKPAKDKASKRADQKVEQLTIELAEVTGVDVGDVAKILDQLGIESAIANRVDRVQLEHLRVALAQVPL